MGGKEGEKSDGGRLREEGGSKWWFLYQRGPFGLWRGYLILKVEMLAAAMSLSFLNQAGSSPKGSGMMERAGKTDEEFSWEVRRLSLSSFGSIEGRECVLAKEEACFTWVVVAVGDSVGFFVDFLLCHKDLVEDPLRESLRETRTCSSMESSSASSNKSRALSNTMSARRDAVENILASGNSSSAVSRWGIESHTAEQLRSIDGTRTGLSTQPACFWTTTPW